MEIGNISFQGLQRVNESFLRKRLLIHPGERYDPKAIEKARQAWRLAQEKVVSGSYDMVWWLGVVFGVMAASNCSAVILKFVSRLASTVTGSPPASRTMSG